MIRRFQRRRQPSAHLLETLEPRQLMSGITKLPDIVLLRNLLNTPTPSVPSTPSSPRIGAGTISPNAASPITAVLAVVPNNKSIPFGLDSEMTQPGFALQGTIRWGDGTSSKALFRRNLNGDFEVLGTHTYASPGTYTILVDTQVAAFIPEGYTGPVPAFVAVYLPPDNFSVKAIVGEALPAPAPTPVITVAKGVNVKNKVLAVLPKDTYTYKLKSEVTTPGQLALTGYITWGDGNFSSAQFRRNANGDVEVFGDYEYAANGAYDVKVNVTTRASLPDGYVGPPVDMPSYDMPVATFDLKANVADVVTQTDSLTVVGFPKAGVVGEAAGGVLVVLPGSIYKVTGEPGNKTIVGVKIEWGDGSAEWAYLTRIGIEGDIAASAYHVYNRPGNFRIKATAIFSSDVVDPLALIYVPPAQVVLNTSIAVALNSPGGKTVTTKNRTVNGVIATIPNPGNFPKTSGLKAAISRPAAPGQPATVIKASVTWGDGTFGDVLLRSNGRGFDVIGNHKYADDGSYRITIYLTAAYNGGPFSETIQTYKSLALSGNVPGNFPFRPLSFPLVNYRNFIMID